MPLSLDPAQVYLVRRTQKAIARDFLLLDLAKHLGRDVIQAVAEQVCHHYFPRAVRRQNSANLEDLTELYGVLFLLAPLIYRLTGSYRPDWNVGTVLSWLRRCITTNTHQMRWAIISKPILFEPESVYSSLRIAGKIRDETFLQIASQLVANLAQSDGRKSSLARLFIDPFLGHEMDSEIDRLLHVKSHGTSRTKLRARGAPVGSYLRMGERAIVLADPASSKKVALPDGAEWCDIREMEIELGDYRIQWMHTENHLRVRLDDAAIAASIREIKMEMDNARTPAHKFDRAMRISNQFLTAHRYATGSLQALQNYEREVSKLVRKKVTATAQRMTPPKGRVAIYNGLVLPITNPFLELDKAKLSDTTWLSFWNPYRQWVW